MAIKSVTQVPDPCECGEARVIVTFDDGKQTVMHDDGSLLEYLGESNHLSVLP